MEDADPYVRSYAACALGEMGADAKDVLPALRRFLKETPTPAKPTIPDRGQGAKPIVDLGSFER